MFEKLFALAAMVAVVGTVFHLYGEADAGPQAVIAPAPVVANVDVETPEEDIIEAR
ncbi:MAG: hypothetical protein ACXIVF_02750 [Rhizobiaceae bacterium]